MDSVVEVETPKVARINSSNFVNYLIDAGQTREGQLRGDIDDFEKQIVVPEEVHQAIKEMYEQRREGLITGPTSKVRQKMMAVEMERILPGLGEAISGMTPKVGSLEQAKVIYVNMGTGALEATASVYGFGTEVDLSEPIKEVVAKSGLPVMPIHTHPEDVNFSFGDYSLMLLGNPSEKLRFFKANMVLLSNMQVMAVATDDTPIFASGDEVDSLIQSHDRESYQKQTELTKKTFDALKKISDRIMLVEGIETVKQILGEKHTDIVEEAAKKYNLHEGESSELETEYNAEAQRGMDESSRAMNSVLMKFSRELNVKLYFSQDMRTFKEFSA